ncbi:MAG: hypothetical protein R3246_16315, partial [Acidimicrobiia bacterium]|nr:hypothetical protein [Acidimicrobiia bacterium]
TVIPITAIPDGKGWVFDHWIGEGNGSYSGPNPVALVTMNEPITQTAVFVNEWHYLDMQAEGEGTVSPPSQWWPPGTVVPITATPDSAWLFSHWVGEGDGSYSGTDSVSTVTVNGPITQTAVFLPRYLWLTMATVGGGTVTPKSQEFERGTVVPITATPDSGWAFGHWIGEGEGSYSGPDSAATVTMNDPITQTAVFLGLKSVHVFTEPPGLRCRSDGVWSESTHDFEWVLQSVHGISVDRLQSLPGFDGRQRFTHWSNGHVARSFIYHPLTTDPDTVTAFFTQEFQLAFSDGQGGTTSPKTTGTTPAPSSRSRRSPTSGTCSSAGSASATAPTPAPTTPPP